nr:PREDICTED: glucan endo-1,3-beta-glucosidase 3-like isoform X2 [Musa acuminata subsp. malaccensis]
MRFLPLSSPRSRTLQTASFPHRPENCKCFLVSSEASFGLTFSLLLKLLLVFRPSALRISIQMSNRWKRCVVLLLFVLSNASEVDIIRCLTTAACAYGKEQIDRNLQPRLVAEKRLSFSGTRRSLSSSNLVFCVANSSASPSALRSGLDWACGPGSANCSAIQPGQPCYRDDNLVALASYAYNDYYQKMRAIGGTCDFRSTAMITATDPSHGSCIFTGSSGNTSAGRNDSATGQPPFVPAGTDGAMPLQVFRATYLLLIILHFLL